MLYNEQAAHCAARLSRTTDPKLKALIEREQRDWLNLARQRRSWAEPCAHPKPQLRTNA